MSGPSRDELEARVARLERLLTQVLTLLRDLSTGSGVQLEEAEDEVPEEVPRGVSAEAPPPGDIPSASLRRFSAAALEMVLWRSRVCSRMGCPPP